MTLDLTFHGGAGCVTGFCARLTTEKASVLIDCGMFQGSKTLKALNYGRFPFDATEIDAVLLTHAHIDHSGLLPKLLRAGFKGPILATAGTRDLCAVMLPDAGDIQESEVRHLNRRNEQRGREPVEPIYTVRDAERTLELFQPVKLGREVEVAPGITARYWEAGHILGSASIEVRVETSEGPVTLLFSGDLGPGGRDFLPDPQGPSGVDYLVLESTYGDRPRTPLDPASRRRLLAQELRDAQKAGGPLLIPAFAVERSQELLADLQILTHEERFPRRTSSWTRRSRSRRPRCSANAAGAPCSSAIRSRTFATAGGLCSFASPGRATGWSACGAGISSWRPAACATRGGCESI